MRAAIAILLLAALGAVVWLWWFAPTPAPPLPLGPSPEQEVPTPPVPEAPVQAAADAVAVVVMVESRARILPPVPAPDYEVWRGQQRLPVPVEVVAGAHASWFEAVPGSLSLVRLDLQQAGSHWRAVTPAAVGPTRIQFGPLCIVRGRVADSAGKAVAGARVWTGACDAAGQRLEVETDADGAFSVDVMLGPGVPLVVQKDGMASQARWLDLDLAGADRLVVALEPEAVVQVQVAAEQGVSPDVRIAVLPGDVASTGVQQYPFFLQAVDGPGTVDEHGLATLRGLPRAAELRLAAVHPLGGAAAPVRFNTRGERTTAMVSLRLLPAVHGRVVDGRGQPVAMAMVRCRRDGEPRRPADRRLLPEAVCEPGLTAVTGADGRFAVGFPGQGSALEVRQPGGVALRFTLDRAGELERDLLLPDGQGGATRLIVPAASAEPWLVRIKPDQADYTAVAAGQPFALALQEGMLADLRVLVRRDGRWSDGRLLRDAVVSGDFTLPAALLQ